MEPKLTKPSELVHLKVNERPIWEIGTEGTEVSGYGDSCPFDEIAHDPFSRYQNEEYEDRNDDFDSFFYQ